MSGYGFTCVICREHDEMHAESLEDAVRRIRRLFCYVKVRGTAERDLSTVYCPYHHAVRLEGKKR